MVVLRSQERALSFPEIRNPGFIHYRGAEGPGMAYIHLLRSRLVQVAEAGQKISGLRLEFCKGLRIVCVVEIVIHAQVLAFVDVMIQLDGELILVLLRLWNRLKDIVGIRQRFEQVGSAFGQGTNWFIKLDRDWIEISSWECCRRGERYRVAGAAVTGSLRNLRAMEYSRRNAHSGWRQTHRRNRSGR